MQYYWILFSDDNPFLIATCSDIQCVITPYSHMRKGNVHILLVECCEMFIEDARDGQLKNGFFCPVEETYFSFLHCGQSHEINSF